MRCNLCGNREECETIITHNKCISIHGISILGACAIETLMAIATNCSVLHSTHTVTSVTSYQVLTTIACSTHFPFACGESLAMRLPIG